MRYFITGATGFLGSALARQLLERGHERHAVVRNPDKAQALKAPGVNLFPGDVSDKASMRPAMCWTPVEDVAAGHMLAMEKGKPGETYIIAGEESTLGNALRLAAEYSGIRPPPAVPPEILKIMSFLIGPSARILPLRDLYTSEGLRVVAGVTYIGDNRKARTELGYSPRSLREGWRPTVEYEMKLLGWKP